MIKYVLLDDNAIEIGGTNLTILSMIEDRASSVIPLSTSKITLEEVLANKNNIWLIGNIMHLLQRKDQIIDTIFNNIMNFVKIEFDYNFCEYRGEIPHQILGGTRCICPHGYTGNSVLAKIYDNIIKKAKHIFFMSERQRSIYSQHLPMLDFSKTTVLSSCFSKADLALMKDLKDNPKNDKYAILQGFGGWHSQAKGLEDAIQFCEINKVPYDVLPIQKHEDHIKTLAKYKSLVFLPIIDDTCPRAIIEARLLGLEVITNINCQHVTEWWWKDQNKTLEYVQSRPKFFWNIIDSL
jgi:hypothetical protein